MSERVGLDEVLDVLSRVDHQSITHEIETLRAIKQWALDHMGIDYAVGDKVQLKASWRMPEFHADGVAHGWWHFRECLVPGATAIVRDIKFNRYSLGGKGSWHANVIFDRQWSVHDSHNLDGKVTRHWQGPVDDTPEGMIPPSDYDQRNSPTGRKGLFSFRVEELEPASAEAQAGCQVIIRGDRHQKETT